MKSVQSSTTKSTLRFSATLAGTSLLIPKSAAAQFSGKTHIEGVINHLPFQTAVVEPCTSGYRLVVSKSLHEFSGIQPGDIVVVELTRIGDETGTRTPTDLRAALKVQDSVASTWADITPLARRDWIFWILLAKQDETRARRIHKAISMLAAGKRRVCCFAGIPWV